MNCKFCNKSFNKIGAHERCCILNPDRDIAINKLKQSSIIAKELVKNNWQDKFQEILEIVKSKNGICLSDQYSGYLEKIKIQCVNGHIWETIPYSILSGHWCRKCADKDVQLSIEEFIILAESRGGKCLSKSYDYANQKLLWECKFKHKWEAKPSQIKCNGSWCPLCQEGLYERICRSYMEQLFDANFKKVRPSWLIGKNNTRLELDGYSEKLNIAFEHNGYRHYIKNTTLIENDIIKKDLCKQRGVKLIVIPELFNMIKIENLKDFIKNEAVNLNINIPENFNNIEVDLKPAYANNHDQEMLEKIKLSLDKINMNLLNKEYTGILSYVDLQCNICNKIYNKKVVNILLNPSFTYCESCHPFKIKVEKIKSIINLLKGKLITDIKVDSISKRTKLKCQCSNGHFFEKKAISLLKKSWCHSCRMLNKPIISRISLSVRQEFAEKYGGKCLDIQDLKSTEKSKWICENNHEFEVPFFLIKKRKYFCQLCRDTVKEHGIYKIPISEYKLKAIENEGLCLSDNVSSCHEKLTWQCKLGHIWQASGVSVRNNNHWCPECTGTKKYTLDQINEIALKKDGKCLSNTYFNTKIKLKWQCKLGHIWETPLSNIIDGCWCPQCAKLIPSSRKLSIDIYKKVAEEKGGKCLSNEINTCRDSLEWQCGNGHVWNAKAYQIKNTKQWCPECAIINKRKK